MSPDPVTIQVPGLPGINAYTLTTASFIQPAISSTVAISVLTSVWAAIGQYVAISGAGSYQVTAKPDSLTMTLRNTGGVFNAIAGSTIAAASTVSPSGDFGGIGGYVDDPSLNHDVGLADFALTIGMSNGSDNTVTILNDTDSELPIGFTATYIAIGGSTVFTPASGVTILSVSNHTKLSDQYAGASITKTSANTWLLIGSLIAAPH